MAKDETKELEERSDITIEGNVATWELKAEGDINGTYMGVFKFKCFLTPLQQIRANREYRELLGANPTMTPEHESFLAYALTQLKQRIVQAPPFWTSANPDSPFAGDIADENIISAILDAAISAEMKYKDQIKKRRQTALDKANKAIAKLEESQKVEEAEDEEDEDEG